MRKIKDAVLIVLGTWVIMIVLSIIANIIGFTLELGIIAAPMAVAAMFIYEAGQEKKKDKEDKNN